MKAKFKRWKVELIVESGDESKAKDVISDLDTTFCTIAKSEATLIEEYEEEF